MTETKVNRFVRVYSKRDDSFIEEILLEARTFSLEDLQKLFNVEKEDPMYDCYPLITSEQINYFLGGCPFETDFDLYDYRLEADAAN